MGLAVLLRANKNAKQNLFIVALLYGIGVAAALAVFVLINLFYFAPQFSGQTLLQGDVQQYKGSSEDIMQHREKYGEDPQWEGNMFGGMPAYLINVQYEGTVIKTLSKAFYFLGQPAALILETTAPDGYSGRIDLIVAVRADGSVSGVRAVSQRETPGLGDYIDPKKDKNKKSPWIAQFAELKAADIPGCKVIKDGGQIAYHTGATISARAVTNAVARAARYAADNQNRLFAAPSGSSL